MIKRIWHGWTTGDDADTYQQLLETTIVPAITSRGIAGHLGTEILRSNNIDRDEVEFLTIMTFTDWAAIRDFAGGDGSGSVIPDAARRLLTRFDAHSAHFDVVADQPAA